MRSLLTFKRSGSQDTAVTERELRNRSAARQAAAGGMVLLKNEGLLPLAADTCLALFGSGAGHTIKGGMGSGDVNERKSVSIAEGLREAGCRFSNEGWLSDYDRRYRQAREDWRDRILGACPDVMSQDFFNTYSENPFQAPAGREFTAEDIEGAEAAIYVISRVAGEGADRKLEKGDYYLTDREREELRWLDSRNVPTVLIINSGAQVELTEALEIPHIQAVMFISQPGEEGGNAVADILLGKVTPSGKLTATWAGKYEDYPSSEIFGALSGDLEKAYYREGIYVGYRYFDSFEKEPLFPFGYGLSYTEFDVRPEENAGAVLRADEEAVYVAVEVQNVGNTYAGREVVQLYVSCPQAGMPKEFQRLAGFIKTPLLMPQETWQGTIPVPAKMLASFDETRQAWILEEGSYGLWLGNSSRNHKLIGTVEIGQEILLEQVKAICPQEDWLLEQVRPDSILQREKEWQKRAQELELPSLPFSPKTTDRPQPFTDEIRREARRMAARLTTEEMLPLFCGRIRWGQSALGAAGTMVPGSAAETTPSLKEKCGIASVTLADGPAGLRLMQQYEVEPETGRVIDYGFASAAEGGFFLPDKDLEHLEVWHQYCTAFPVGTLLAQSFDPELVEMVGRAEAEELEEFHVSWWLAPGMNIQRNPLCGRNFEYFSEDPLVSGVMAAAMTRGVQTLPGVGTTIKHFACNNQEDNRMGVDSVVSERALREIYLRGFEIAVRTAQPMCIMTSYNLVNGVHTANSYDLCTEAARREWGFEGVIMTDWTTTFPFGGSEAWKCIAAGNDLIMPGCDEDLQNIREALADGRLSETDLRECAARIIDSILRSNAYRDAVPYNVKLNEF